MEWSWDVEKFCLWLDIGGVIPRVKFHMLPHPRPLDAFMLKLLLTVTENPRPPTQLSAMMKLSWDKTWASQHTFSVVRTGTHGHLKFPLKGQNQDPSIRILPVGWPLL